MATANIVYGKVGGLGILDSDFTSVNVAAGNVSASIPAHNAVRVAAIDGAIYVAFGSVASGNPRVHLGAIGVSIDVRMTAAGTISIENG